MKNNLFLLLVILFSCKQDAPIPKALPVYKTKNIFIVVMDGARYSETWGDSKQQNIPRIRQLALQGVICTEFYNSGQTLTVPGHTAMTTGTYEVLNNSGFEVPSSHSIFQQYLSQFSKPAQDAWVISSKDKLEVLSECQEPGWAGKFRPRTDCGRNGNHTGYRQDSITYVHLFDTISRYHPHLVLVNFQEPDMSGHANNWTSYINQVGKIDQYIGNIWDFLQRDSIYAGTTTLFVTNDHGRHLEGVYDGFVSHWCDCRGCRKIFLLGLGPDFKVNYEETTHYSLVDIPATAAKLLGVDFNSGEGKVMATLLK